MLTILCIPLSAIGHINPCVAVCGALRKSGHRIIIAADVSCKGKFIDHGFEEVTYKQMDVNNNLEDNAQFWSQFIERQSSFFRKSDKERFQSRQLSYANFISIAKASDKQLANVIATVRPDVIIHDSYVTYPCVVNSGIPFVLLFIPNPMKSIENENLPPALFGLPLNDKSEWSECEEIREQCLGTLWKEFDKWIVANGCPPLKYMQFQHLSPFLNIHIFPKFLYEEYAKRSNLGNEFILIQHMVNGREDSIKMDLPEYFSRKPGKIIYLSLGSMASSDTDLMRRLIHLLSKSKHKVIVSMGNKHNEYQLAENMWGQPFLPQLKVLEICDIFLTHAGNGSLTEALYFGKPMIVMPLFNDQMDNAQRLIETKLGKRVDPFTVSSHELNSTIDSMLNDTHLMMRLQEISDEMKKCDGFERIVSRIEGIAASTINGVHK